MAKEYSIGALNFEFSEEQIAVKEAARDFARTRLLPGVIERDEAQQFDPGLLKEMGDMGFLGMMVSPEYGGGGWTPYLMSWPWKKLRRSMRRQR